MLRSAAWRSTAAAKLLALVAAAVLSVGTLEVASHSVSNHALQKLPINSAQYRLFYQMTKDLKPFASGISLQQVERAFCGGADSDGFRYKAVLSEPLEPVCASQRGSQAGSDMSVCQCACPLHTNDGSVLAGCKSLVGARML